MLKTHLPLGLAILLFGSAAAFAGGQTPAPAGAGSPAAPTLKAGGDDDKMKAFVAANCTTCHEISTLSATPHAAGDWDAILQRMVGYHPPLADADLKALQAYLARAYPEKAN